jgi:hypothetical protein
MDRVIAQKLAEADAAGHITIPGFVPGQEKDDLTAKIEENLSKFESAGRSELEAAFAPVPEGGPGYESAENESDADQDVGEL